MKRADVPLSELSRFSPKNLKISTDESRNSSEVSLHSSEVLFHSSEVSYDSSEVFLFSSVGDSCFPPSYLRFSRDMRSRKGSFIGSFYYLCSYCSYDPYIALLRGCLGELLFTLYHTPQGL